MTASVIEVAASEGDLIDFYGRPMAPHVPRHLVRRVNQFSHPVLDHDPFELIRALREEPPVIYNLYNPLKGQSWLLTRAEHMRQVLSNPDLFAVEGQSGFSQLIGEDWRMGPLEMDQPDHGKFRKLMNPWFSPPAVEAMTRQVRDRAVSLIDAIVAKGGCEFVGDFGVPYPISIFMELMGLPLDQMDTFLDWVSQLLHSDDPSVKAAGAGAIAAYLRALIAERRADPRDDLATRVATAVIDDQPIGDDDALGTAFVLFTGGLDTIAASLGFYFHHLATNPEAQARLRARPEDIPKAIEEYLRVYSPVQASRQAKADTEIAGVKIFKGDWVSVLYGVGSLDPQEFDRPDEVDFDRGSNRHFAFAFGPHFCMGAHLARRELHIAIEEWLRRVPPFRLADGHRVRTRGGVVLGVREMHLQW